MALESPDCLTPGVQIARGLRYIKSRYGKPERVLSPQQTIAFEELIRERNGGSA